LSGINKFPFNEAGCDLVQLDDLGFLIIGRTRNLAAIADFDCQIIRTNSNGDTIWTKRFGDSMDNWLDKFISNNQGEFVIQGGQNISDTKSTFYKINEDGEILDSVRMDRLLKIVYSPLKYYLKTQTIDTSYIKLSKIYSNELFN
jgi:hypothetical protein